MSVKRATGTRAEARAFSVEGALWIALLALAVTMRLSNLGAAPLTSPEAGSALAAWRAVQDGGSAGAGAGSNGGPLVLALTACSFGLFGASDIAARMPQVLAGSALALSPWLLRRRLGRTGSLAAGLMLAISPTLLVASRQVDGSALAALGCMLALAGSGKLLEGRSSRWLTLIAIGLAIAFAASPIAFGLLAPPLVAVLAVQWARTTRNVRAVWEGMRSGLPRFAIVFFVALTALSTGMGWRPTGLAESADAGTRWASGFILGSGQASIPLLVTGIYEFLVISLAIGGVAWSIRTQRRFGVFLGIWAGLGSLTLALRPRAHPLEAISVVIPAALSAGISANAIVRKLCHPDSRIARAILTPSGIGVCAYIGLLAAHYAKQARLESIVMILLALGIQVLLFIAVKFAMHARHSWPSLAAGWSVALLAATVSVGWGVTHVRPSDAREIVLDRPTDSAIRLLIDTLTDLSWEKTGSPHQMALSYESQSDSALTWYLRDFALAYRIDPGNRRLPVDFAEVHISGPEVTEHIPPDALGQDFPLARSWDPTALSCTWSDVPDCPARARWQFASPDGPSDQGCAWYERLDCSKPFRWLSFRSEPSLQSMTTQAVVLWISGDLIPE